MNLLVARKNEVGRLILQEDLILSDFEFISNDSGESFVLKQNRNVIFMYRHSIYGGKFCDIFYTPTKDSKSLYIKCDSFEEFKPHIIVWLKELVNEKNVDMWENNITDSL